MQRAGGCTATAAKFDLSLALTPKRPRRWRGVVEYSTDLFDAATVAAHGAPLPAAAARPSWPHPEHVDRAAAAAGRRPSAQQLLHGWNDTARECPRELSAAPAVRAAGAAQPRGGGACCSTATTLSYAQLNARANRLAHHLRALGVGPDVLVGLCLPRARRMVVAMLAILKAGGRLRAAGPAVPGRAAGLHARRHRRAVLLTAAPSLRDALPHTATPHAAAASSSTPTVATWPARDQPDPAAATARPPRLRHLHLRLHRHPQGRR